MGDSLLQVSDMDLRPVDNSGGLLSMRNALAVLCLILSGFLNFLSSFQPFANCHRESTMLKAWFLPANACWPP